MEVEVESANASRVPERRGECRKAHIERAGKCRARSTYVASSRFHAFPSISLTWVEQVSLLRILEKFRDTM